jgi:rhodanese-related sulfurtransferase
MPFRTGLVRRKRNRLTRRKRKRIKPFNLERLDTMTEFELLRLAILNSVKIINSNRQSISAELILLKKKKNVKYNIPRKYRTRSVESYFGEIPYRNLLLWCTSANTSKRAALCLSISAPGCEDENPKFPILYLVNKKCKEGSCNGILKPWNFIERKSK